MSYNLVRRLALASLVVNVLIVVTGGAVRLTGSGLGCPTWPRCTDDSYVATPEMGIYGAIEFGNRLISIVVGAIAVASLLAVALGLRDRPVARRALLPLAVGVLALVLVQGVIGGISVRVQLDPWVVAAHFLLSMVLLAFGHTLWRRAEAHRPDPQPAAPQPAGTAPAGAAPAGAAPAPLRGLGWVLTVVSFAVLAIGTVVTGSGPHSGDPEAGRTGLDPETVSQIHADLVFLLVGLTIGLWFALRAVGAPARAVSAVATLFAVEMGQGLIGFVQYFTHLPVLLVGAHMLGACLVWLATLSVLWELRAGVPAGPAPATPLPEPALAAATPTA